MQCGACCCNLKLEVNISMRLWQQWVARLSPKNNTRLLYVTPSNSKAHMLRHFGCKLICQYIFRPSTTAPSATSRSAGAELETRWSLVSCGLNKLLDQICHLAKHDTTSWQTKNMDSRRGGRHFHFFLNSRVK